MRQLIILLFSFSSTSLLAQTKDIAFESHSGDKTNFEITVNKDLFDNDNSDFGLPAPKEIKTYTLDSVIYVSEKVAILVTSEFRRSPDEPNKAAQFWNMKRDTVDNDPLFSRKHSLDSIRNVLQTSGHYSNPARKIIFVGYDNKKPKSNKQSIIPVAVPGKGSNTNRYNINDDHGNDYSPLDKKLVLMLGTILLLSLLGGWVSWKYFQPRLQ